MLKKTMALLLVSVLCLSTFAGCAGNSSPEGSDGSVLSAEEQEKEEFTDSDVLISDQSSDEEGKTQETTGDNEKNDEKSDASSEKDSGKKDSPASPSSKNPDYNSGGKDHQVSPQPYSVKKGDTVLTVTGSSLGREYYFSLLDLKGMSSGISSGTYFSRGKDPKEASNRYLGVSVDYLISEIVKSSPVKKITVTAKDGYRASFSKNDISRAYINEKDPSQSLRMILAWQEDSSACSLRLITGQKTAGDYNRTNWVRDVVRIELQ